jgi:aspartate/methionine/tyrosine aminotransferase
VAETALRFDNDAVVVNSFSKYWCMTGWRIGWLVVPEELERPVERLAQNLFISAPKLSQVAAIAALDAKFDPARDAAADLQLAMVEAQRSGRRIVLDVGGEWCPWCHRMDAFLHDDAELHALRAAGYVWMKVNYSEENENTAFLARFPEVKGYPHLFVLDADGKLLHSQFTGALEKGKSYDREKFLAFLKAWAPQHS